jgi:energy-coupling factor transport system ATP-binding protein
VGFTYAYAERPALVDVHLQLDEGRLHGIVGLNSSGKTTLCSLIRGVIPHFHRGELTGEIEVLGRPLLDWEPADLSRTIGCVFDNPFTQISGIRDTVFEEIALGLENLGVEREAMIDRVERVVEQLGIQALVGKNPNELSGGQRQKVAFASIIAMDAPVVVIDEPTSQLDPESSEAVFEIIDGLKRSGKSIVLAEHKIDLLAQFADTITVMHEGTVVMHGPTRTVIGSDELSSYGIEPPEVTELGRRLGEAGKPLERLPLTRFEAFDALTARIRRSSHAN